MNRPKTLPAFTPDERREAHKLLATKVAFMMGRKLEEGDWAGVYCEAKNIPNQGWSNLQIDVMHGSLGVEHKMLCYRSHVNLAEACGRTLMHPSATRSIRVPPRDTDPDEAMRKVLTQYADLIETRGAKVQEQSGTNIIPDMRTGWLLWQESLCQFLYFEEEMLPPNPDDYTAKWVKSGGGSRKESINLWVYEKETGRKKYSITTDAGAKIQPYFDVPPPTDPNLYLFTVIGEVIDTGFVRVWITETTARELNRLLGKLDTETISHAIIEAATEISKLEPSEEAKMEVAQPLLISTKAYEALQRELPGVSDEHSFQLLAQHLRHLDKIDDAS
jgi:hypothetical protein